MSSYKRKEGGEFQEKWRKLYFCGKAGEKSVCLICREQILAIEDKVREHYKTYHAMKYDKFVGKLREDKINMFEYFIKEKQPENETDDQVNDVANKAGYMVAREIAVSSKPLSDGEFLKKCMLMTAGIICPDKRQDFAAINLSKDSVAERVSDLSENVNSQLKDRVRTLVAISVAIESMDVKYQSPLAVFIRGVDKHFEVIEEFVELIPEDKRTTEDIFDCLMVALENIGVDWACIVSLATGREPSALEGVAIKLKEKLLYINPDHQFNHVHCLVHQEMLCNKVLKMTSVLDVFQQITGSLQTILPQQHRLLFCLDIRRGLLGSLLKDLFELRVDILKIMAERGKTVQELQNDKWLRDLAFSIDIKEFFDDLKREVQEQGKCVTHFYDSICAFEVKLELCEKQLSENNLIHLPTLRSLCHTSGDLPASQRSKYIDSIFKLRKEFQDAFSDLKILGKSFKVFQNPFSVNANEVPACLQLEVIELQCDSALKHKFSNVDFRTFYKFLGPSYSRLKRFASLILSMFSSTCAYKKHFSTTCRQNSHRKGTALKSVLRIASAQAFSPNFEELVMTRKCQKVGAPIGDVVSGHKPAHEDDTSRTDNLSSIGIIEIDLCSSDDDE